MAAPSLSKPSFLKTAEGLVGGVASATLLGAVLYRITPFKPWQAALSRPFRRHALGMGSLRPRLRDVPAVPSGTALASNGACALDAPG